METQVGTKPRRMRVVRGRGIVTMVILAAAALIAGVGLHGTYTTSLAYAAAFTSFAASSRFTVAAPELPREWVWERKTITFDHMFLERLKPEGRWNRTRTER